MDLLIKLGVGKIIRYSETLVPANGANGDRGLPTVSVGVITLNAGKTLTQCLESVAGLNYPKSLIQLIVVDAGSRDDTLSIAGLFGAEIYTVPHGAPRGFSTNLALRKAKGDFLILIDADNELPPWWLETSIKDFADPNVAGVYCLQFTPPMALPLLARVIYYIKRGYQFNSPIASSAMGYRSVRIPRAMQSNIEGGLNRRWTLVRETFSSACRTFLSFVE